MEACEASERAAADSADDALELADAARLLGRLPRRLWRGVVPAPGSPGKLPGTR
jgi:hypothetical protein